MIQSFAHRLRAWLDRKFFREAYEADVILADLAARVPTMMETGPLLETVATSVAEALHVSQIAILLDGKGVFRPAFALGYPASPGGMFTDASLTLRRLKTTSHATVEFEDADSWVQLTEPSERAALEELKPELLLPLSLKEKVLGIMSLGPKQSEEPFSPTDLRLLNSVAAQTGLALENGRLTDAIREEARAREKQNREVELGREVQERLFPQGYPPVTGLDYAGACRPAMGVGGDYYDFIQRSESELCIAIGDVSGKGIPAALLMATLRAFVRGQTVHHQGDLAAMIANLNKLVYESSASNRYATFFYSEFDATSRVLRYVNAGHNAPMVFRTSAGSREVIRLEEGGSVVGLMPVSSYTQGSAALQSGDVLVAYTDGISEAMDAADNEWGEDRMMDSVWTNRTARAEEIIKCLMTGADTFVAGAPQHDDMTLIVVKVA